MHRQVVVATTSVCHTTCNGTTMLHNLGPGMPNYLVPSMKRTHIRLGLVFTNTTPPVLSVCRTQHSTSLMILGRTSCFSGWTLEYAGYLAANWIGTKASTTNFVCIDGHPEVLNRGATNDNQAVVHNVVAKCGSLPCPPYVDGLELACVVCSK